MKKIMRNFIKWKEKDIFDYTNLQVNRIKEQKECWNCHILYQHIEMYQDIIHNLLEL